MSPESTARRGPISVDRRLIRLECTRTLQYLEKATTGLPAQARLEPPDFDSITDGVELVVPVRGTL